MGFTFRKLYPTIVQVSNCCSVVCECRIPVLGSEIFCWVINIAADQACRCPSGEGGNDDLECIVDPQTCGSCSYTICPPINQTGNWWTWWWNLNIALCAVYNNEPCYLTEPYPGGNVVCGCRPTEADPNGECCPDFVCIDRIYGPTGGNRGTAGFYQIFDNCYYEGATPRTYKFNGTLYGSCGGIAPPSNTASFPYGVPYSRNDIPIQSTNRVFGLVGDPEFTPSRIYQRYYRDPWLETTTPKGLTTYYESYCLKMHKTQSQERGIENRLMVISSINNYRYAGLLSGDPVLGASDIFWDDPSPGGSGIKQYETSIVEGGTPREFPLPNRILGLPLWGEESPDNNGLLPIDCISPYCNDSSQTNQPFPICHGCRCIQTDPSQSDPTPVGHFLTNDPANSFNSTAGYTAGYFSFAEFNPHAHLDHVSDSGLQIAGRNNLLGFGALSDSLDSEDNRYARFNCSYDSENLIPISCGGMSGATSHGPRLGVPTCSLWSLVKAVYSRVLKAFVQNGWALSDNLGTPLTEANFRNPAFQLNGQDANFSRFATAVDNLLAANPAATTVPPSGWSTGTSLVQFHLAKVQEALKLDSTRFFNAVQWTTGFGNHFVFTFPSVFLWDPDKYTIASSTDKWKHLYVIGNANIIHDTRSIAVTGPYDPFRYNSPQETGRIVHDDVADQDWLTQTFYVRTIEDSNRSYRTRTLDPDNQTDAARARIFLFNGSGGTASIGDPPDIIRRNASSKISLVKMPVCVDGITGHPCLNELPVGVSRITPCEVCNAFPNPICFADRDEPLFDGVRWSAPGTGCSDCIVTELETDVIRYMCSYKPAEYVEFNSLTASYKI